MFAEDFFYAGEYLSSFGFMICNFESSSGSEVVSAGSTITFNTVPRHRGKKYSLTGTQYDECIQSKFTIAKKVCLDEDMMITKDEYRDLMRWLNRHEFLKFQILDESEDFIEPCYFNASFNVEKRLINGKLYGLDLTLETDKPFGYGEEIVMIFDLTKKDEDGEYKCTVIDTSDEIGHIYPDLTITVGGNQKADLRLTNLTFSTDDGDYMEFYGCEPKEVINVYGDTFIIKSNLDGHNLYDNFNFNFLRIENTYDNRENVITTTLPCTLEIKYRPIIKDTPN